MGTYITPQNMLCVLILLHKTCCVYLYYSTKHAVCTYITPQNMLCVLILLHKTCCVYSYYSTKHTVCTYITPQNILCVLILLHKTCCVYLYYSTKHAVCTHITPQKKHVVCTHSFDYPQHVFFFDGQIRKHVNKFWLKKFSYLELLKFFICFCFRPVFRSYKPQDESLKSSSLPQIKPADGMFTHTKSVNVNI